MTVVKQFPNYLQLIRFNKPIGVLLLLWPTLWALWFAAGGVPPLHILLVFVLGTFLMRSAGCIINDIADRDWDGKVERTKGRPLVTGVVSLKEAIILFVLLSLISFLLVLTLNALAIKMAFAGILLACIYPFTKRYTHLPQLFLGFAFAWGLPMAFAAVTGHVPVVAWWLYLINIVWVIGYDTEYAMVDRADDLKVGIKSTAILFGRFDRVMVLGFMLLTLLGLVFVGRFYQVGVVYYVGIGFAAALMVYQQVLIKDREPKKCFQAFLNNHWVGFVVFVGVIMSSSFT